MTLPTPTSPSLPQSNALAEAEVDSIGHLLSLDSEGLRPEDRQRIITAFRAQRVRWEATEAAEGTRPKRTASRVVSPATVVESEKKAEDLGL